jgi:hypothetical protein
MQHITPGRTTAEAPSGTVVFLIGLRVNRPFKPHKWFPVFRQMPRMLAELHEHPELGLLAASTYLSGRTVLVVQYWASADHLNTYATARDHVHLPAWREFNRRIKDNGDVGVFHETYILGGGHETIYVNMPANFGLAGATTMQPVGRKGNRALHRLDPTIPDTPAVQPY